MMTRPDPHFAGYCCPPEIFQTALWLYNRFPLSLRVVEEMLAGRNRSLPFGCQRDKSDSVVTI